MGVTFFFIKPPYSVNLDRRAAEEETHGRVRGFTILHLPADASKRYTKVLCGSPFNYTLGVGSYARSNP